jgi:hypothetical protein
MERSAISPRSCPEARRATPPGWHAVCQTPRTARKAAGRLAFQAAVRTEYTGGRWLAAVRQVAPASPEPKTSPDVAPK